MNEIELRILFRRIQNRDQEALGQLYQELAQPIYTIACRITKSRECAEDITHDVFVKLYSTPPEESVKNIRAWIFQMVRNASIDVLRRNARAADGGVEPGRDSFDRLHSRLDLEAALNALPQPEREILTLHLNAELSFKDISLIVGLSPAAVYRKYRKALKTIREKMNGGLT